jgi:hypothetical protein
MVWCLINGQLYLTLHVVDVRYMLLPVRYYCMHRLCNIVNVGANFDADVSLGIGFS